MAQALFHEHPLQTYLRDIGESTDALPPTVPGHLPFDSIEQQYSDESDSMQMLSFMRTILNPLHAVFISPHAPGHAHPFEERFKYNVISSALLSSSIFHHLHGQQTPHIPGRLSPGQRAENLDSSFTIPPSESFLGQETLGPGWIINFALVTFAAILTTGHYVLAILWIAVVYSYYMYAHNVDIRSKPTMLSTLDCLQNLNAAGDVWDSVIHDAIDLLEKEEQNVFGSPTNPTSPSSPLRVALHSSLHTTQTQCDNIRQLFTALTSPTELSQLSEMYAPPSPVTLGFSPFRDTPRPLSLPGSRMRAKSTSEDDTNKRFTWNGSYSSLAHAGSPTMQVLKRREKRRSEISSLLEVTAAMRTALSAPVSPIPDLSNVREEEDHQKQEENSYFGAAALELQRERRTSGLESFRLSTPSNVATVSRHASPTISSASRFTAVHTNRHPLSLSSLHHALQGAFASKRYACAHLLALRFNEEDDDGYWEDVRSVMGLLTTTLADASSRLTEALEESEQARLKEENPSLPSHSRSTSTNDIPRMSQTLSFAPMPSHLARFAAHVDVISSALTDAREHLEQCLAAVRASAVQRERELSSATTSTPPSSPPHVTLHEAPAVQAYDHLRRELGLALRECERGRERLLNIVSPPINPRSNPDTDPDDLPGLGQDVGSDESDKTDPISPFLDRREMMCGIDVVGPDGVVDEGGVGMDGSRDDATVHLLLTASSHHLPPQGIEQVFEADSGPDMLFTRERPKLTREERIKHAKARRKGVGMALGLDLSTDGHAPPSSSIEKWGPGGEVVQELKDVIWKVGERRRKMTEGPFPVISTDAPF